VSTKEASRRSPLHDEWAVKVKTRAGWRCEGCGLDSDTIREHGGQLEAAHILPHSEYPDRRYDVANGKALCTFRNRKHPNGLGNGYGCHNAMSGHWGHSYGTIPVPPAHDRWELVGLALLAVSALLFVAAFKAHSHQRAWFEVAVPVLAVSAPLWWVKRRLLVASIIYGTLLWMALLAANILARYSSLRPWTFGSPTTFGGFLGLIVVLLALWGACVILVHATLRRRWLSRAGRGVLHGLLRLARRAKP
jgi:hypothetical protein